MCVFCFAVGKYRLDRSRKLLAPVTMRDFTTCKIKSRLRLIYRIFLVLHAVSRLNKFAILICRALFRCVGSRLVQSEGRQVHKTQREEETTLERGLTKGKKKAREKRFSAQLRRKVAKFVKNFLIVSYFDSEKLHLSNLEFNYSN